eukprot:3940089-Rhodomonas_salina.4
MRKTACALPAPKKEEKKKRTRHCDLKCRRPKPEPRIARGHRLGRRRLVETTRWVRTGHRMCMRKHRTRYQCRGGGSS